MIYLSQRTRSAATTIVAVVDQHPDDYADLLRTVRRADMIWRFLTTGREALRLVRTENVGLWVVNTILADMPGIELCKMLRSRSPPPVLYVVADAYRAEEERAARICGAALFECKPPHPEWFDMGLTSGIANKRKKNNSESVTIQRFSNPIS